MRSTDSHNPRCPRCVGLLLIEQEPYGGPSLIYCANCGWRTCLTMAANRALQPTPRGHQRETRTFPQLLSY